MASGGGGSRRRQLLSDDKVDSPHLRDLLRVKDDDDGRNSLAGLTLSAVLSIEKRSAQPNRTLLDIIRDDPNRDFKDNKKSWKFFRDKIRLRRAAAAWTSTVPIPASDIPMQNSNRMISRRNSSRFSNSDVVDLDDPTPESNHSESPFSASAEAVNNGETRRELNLIPSNRAMMLRRNSSRVVSDTREDRLDQLIRRDGSLNSGENNVAEQEEQRRGVLFREEMEEAPDTEEGVGETAEGPTVEVAEAEAGGEQPRMSLMALLEETDRQMGLDGSTYMMDDEEEEEEKEEESGGRGEYNNCCVCMLRHKGAAFIPCGHTFCRLCSRELWIQRGNCPLCNGFILEILDIF